MISLFYVKQLGVRRIGMRKLPLKALAAVFACVALSFVSTPSANAARFVTYNGDVLLLNGSAQHHRASNTIRCASGKVADVVKNTVNRVRLNGHPEIDAIAYCMDDTVRRSSRDSGRSQIVFINKQRVLLPNSGLFLLKKTNLYCENGSFATLTRNFSTHSKDAAYIKFDAIASCGDRVFDQISEGGQEAAAGPPGTGSGPGPGPGGPGPGTGEGTPQ